ncbi:MAG: hypothetical protein ACLUFN_02240 [Eubacterium sp.]
MKKVLLIIMCVIISFTFVSCSNDTSSPKEASSRNKNEIVTDDNSDISESSNTDEEKNIEKLYVDYNGFKMDIDFEENDITELLDAEKKATVPDVKMKMVFADVIAVYNDSTEDIFGTICVGEDDCYYLQFANSKVEGAAFKMSDSLFSNELF